MKPSKTTATPAVRPRPLPTAQALRAFLETDTRPPRAQILNQKPELVDC